MAKICILQLATLPISDARLDYYLKLAKERGVGLVVMGEYILNSFFNELIKLPKQMIKEQSERKKTALFEFAKKYDLTIVAPIVTIKGEEIYKCIAKFTPQNIKFNEQNLLISYSHWNEASFFANQKDAPLNLMSFTFDRLKFCVIFGFESHFDAFWSEVQNKKIECVLMPTACTLNSKERWNELLKMRAFTNGVYIIRANRLGQVKFGNVKSEFYGHSMLINPFGEIVDSLDENEGMLVCELDKKVLNEAKAVFKFKDIITKLSSRKS